MAKTITVTCEKETFVLASLTMDQVEEFWDDPTPKDDVRGMRLIIWRNIHNCIRNAGSDITLDQLRQLTTFSDFQLLRDKSLEVSGLIVNAGEQKAVATQTSNSYAAV